jgi:hypothetical protein
LPHWQWPPLALRLAVTGTASVRVTLTRKGEG